MLVFSVKFSVFSVQCLVFTMLSVQCSAFNVQCSVRNVRCAMFIVQCTAHPLLCKPVNFHSQPSLSSSPDKTSVHCPAGCTELFTAMHNMHCNALCTAQCELSTALYELSSEECGVKCANSLLCSDPSASLPSMWESPESQDSKGGRMCRVLWR